MRDETELTTAQKHTVEFMRGRNRSCFDRIYTELEEEQNMGKDAVEMLLKNMLRKNIIKETEYMPSGSSRNEITTGFDIIREQRDSSRSSVTDAYFKLTEEFEDQYYKDDI